MGTAGATGILSQAAQAQSAFSRDALIAGARKEGKLVFYTSGQQTITAKILAEFQKLYPFIDTGEFYQNSAGRIEARLNAEMQARKPIADVISSTSVGTLEHLRQRNRLAQFASPELAQFPAEFQNSGYWTVWAAQPMCLAYDASKLQANQLPDSWTALADPRFQGRIGYEDNTSGTQFVEWYLLRQELGDSFWGKVAANQPRIYPGTTPIVQAVLRGELTFGADIGIYQFVNFQKAGAPLKPIFPKEGVPVALNPIAVLKDAPHPNAARLFVDWMLSPAGQNLVTSLVGNYPARKGIAQPAGLPPYASLKTILPKSYPDFVNAQADFGDAWDRVARGQG